MPNATRSQQPKLLDDVRTVLRLHHSSIHTERSSVEWIVRFGRFHGMRSRADLFPAECKIASFLTDLAVHGHVAAATQHQAMPALVCLSKRVLHHALEDRIHAMRAAKKINVPAVILLLDGTAPLIAKLLYGSGVRLMEAVRLRVKDIDVHMKPLTVRSGKGAEDRFTTFPATLTPLLQNHLTGGQDAASAGPGARAWRGLPAPCAGSEVSACRHGVGLAVCLPRPESLRGPAFRCHPSPSCRPQRHQQGH